MKIVLRIGFALAWLLISPTAIAKQYHPISQQWIEAAIEKMRLWRGASARAINYELIRNSDGKDWLAVKWRTPQTQTRLNIYRVDYNAAGDTKLKTLWDLYNSIILIDGVEDASDGNYKILLLGTSPGGSSTEKDQDLKIALKGNAPLLTSLNCDYMIECPWD